MADDYDNAEALAAQFQTRLDGLGRQGKSRARGGSGGSGGSSGSRHTASTAPSPQHRDKTISHALSRLLRHQAAAADIPLDAQGYARLDRVLQWGPLGRLGATVADVRRVVATNDKQRFRLRGEGEGNEDDPTEEEDPTRLYIRANQGHSIATVASDAGLLTPLTTDAATVPTTEVCHGTYLAAWPAIEAAGGLHRMRRNHVHFGCLPEGRAGVIPGVRRDAQILVFVDVRRALVQAPAVRWWRSANGVVLTEGDGDGRVPVALFARVVLTAAGARALRAAGVEAPPVPTDGDDCLLWKDGQKLVALPADVLSGLGRPSGGGRGGRGGGGQQRGGRGRRGRGGSS